MKTILAYSRKLLGLFLPQSKFSFYLLISALVCIAISYSVYLFFDEAAIIRLGDEDGVFEWLTALFFIVASIVFFLTFRKTNNKAFLFLSIVFFLGCGEEISWGQRIFNFKPTEFITRNNVQNEYTLHNMWLFNGCDFDHISKGGFYRLRTVNFWYKLFFIFWGVILPLGACSRRIRNLLRKFAIPNPELCIGSLFIVNWMVFRVTLSFLLPHNMAEEYYSAAGEIMECISALVFMLIGLNFHSEALGSPAGQTIPSATAESSLEPT